MQGELYAGDLHFAIFAPAPGPNGATFFTHGDWLGTERVRTDMTGANSESITSLPYGDGQSITGTCGDVSPLHFTGKERDFESNLDDFGARYYLSSFGRFMSADWSGLPVPVPYADFTNPQSRNLYGYVGNNPLNLVDPDGHNDEPKPGAKCGLACRVVTWFVSLFYSPPSISKSAQQGRSKTVPLVWNDDEAKRE
jgi:RHS repeat-associated protein